MNDNIVQFSFNEPQAKLMTVMANESYFFGGRATGKTKGDCSLHYPQNRSNATPVQVDLWALRLRRSNRSFSNLYLMPSKILVLNWGCIIPMAKNPLIVGRSPIVLSWIGQMSLPSQLGTMMMFISMHDMGSANSLSAQWLIIDEAKFHKEKRLTRK